MTPNSARSARTEHVQSPMQVFGVPLALGAATTVGLVAALVGDGPWDALSWLALSAPLAGVVWAWRHRGD